MSSSRTRTDARRVLRLRLRRRRRSSCRTPRETRRTRRALRASTLSLYDPRCDPVTEGWRGPARAHPQVPSRPHVLPPQQSRLEPHAPPDGVHEPPWPPEPPLLVLPSHVARPWQLAALL